MSLIRFLAALPTNGMAAQSVVEAVRSLWWLPSVVLLVALGILVLASALIWRPRPGVLPELLPHIATSSLLLSLAASLLALIADLLGMPDRSHYSGMGAIWPRGISLAVSVLITGAGSFILVFPLALIASFRCRRARGV